MVHPPKNFVIGTGLDSDDLFGLYAPAIDRLICVHFNQKVIDRICILLSSKINTCKFKISTAKNYFHNIVDNTVCENWTLKDVVDYDIHHMIRSNVCREFLGELVEVTRKTVDGNLKILLTFIQHALGVLIFIEQISEKDPEKLAYTLTRGFDLNFRALEILDMIDHNDIDVFRDQASYSIRTILIEQRDLAVRELEKIIYWSEDIQQLKEAIYSLEHAFPKNMFVKNLLSALAYDL